MGKNVSDKWMISCEEAALLSTIREFEPLSFREKIQHRLHRIICYLCRGYEKRAKLFSSFVKKTFNNVPESGDIVLSEEKTRQIQQELDKLKE